MLTNDDVTRIVGLIEDFMKANNDINGTLDLLSPCSPCKLGDIIGAMVRLSFHDAAGGGGANGCVDFTERDNNGLQEVVGQLDKIYHDNHLNHIISKADFWVLAANTALRVAKGPTIEFRWGRIDCHSCLGIDDGLLPNATGGFRQMEEVFKVRMGFTDREIVALLGAHCLGRMELKNSGFEGGWTKHQNLFSNVYYFLIPGLPWIKNVNVAGNFIWNTPTGEVMLNADMSLFTDVSVLSCTNFGGRGFGGPPGGPPGGNTNFTQSPSCQNSTVRYFGQLYAANQTLWFEDFAPAYAKLQMVGYTNGELAFPGSRPCCPPKNFGKHHCHKIPPSHATCPSSSSSHVPTYAPPTHSPPTCPPKKHKNGC
jgi:hypothetical protein